MTYPTIYARFEPTSDDTCGIMLNMMPHDRVDPRRSFTFRDVVFYHDKAASQQAMIYPPYKSQPTRRNKWQMMNCARYRIEWLPELIATNSRGEQFYRGDIVFDDMGQTGRILRFEKFTQGKTAIVNFANRNIQPVVIEELHPIATEVKD